MATFVHIAPASQLAAIKRNGVIASRFPRDAFLAKGVFCFPVQQNFFITHQWLRELRRHKREQFFGVYFRIDDKQSVYVGHFHRPHHLITASESVALFRHDVSLCQEVIIPRSVGRSEIIRIKHLPQITGWRVYPEAKGVKPTWPRRGSYGAGKIRSGIMEQEQRLQAQYDLRLGPAASEE